ncbi:MAG: type II toxin-antitoxin system VapC family toxin [Actinomycetota bacterium]|nr:MAG: PilT protein [Actinomycetota bacterium]MDO8950432.1 type II toxin-antitoxin system VapC family toxin [Actinomycetota bacterium]MDP3630169.1 type II toxin-antitoxin system VapC family toxin [Actinomycetota bacterium]
MNAAVFDASVLVKLAIEEPHSGEAARLYKDIEMAIAPDCASIECTSALWKKRRYEGYDPACISEAFRLLRSIDVAVFESAPLLENALEIALSLDHPVYDCIYLALALQEGIPLVTADARLRDVAGVVGIDVLWVGAL